jgi:sugar/nucleoside kinase (ribokinase family)
LRLGRARDFARLREDGSAANGVNSDFVLRDVGLKTGATVIFHYGDDRMMVTHPGAMSHMTVGEIPDELYQKCRHLHTSAIFFQPGIKKDLVDLFKTARAHGLTTSMDTQWDPEEKWELNLNELLPVLDFFLPNEGELLHLTGTSDIQDALGKLSGFDTTIVVKRGENGAIMQKNNGQRSVSAYKIPGFIDAVGAGDSFNAGFIHAFLNGNDLDECLSAGNLTAAVSTTKAGGTDGIVSYKDVMNQKKNFEQASQ